MRPTALLLFVALIGACAQAPVRSGLLPTVDREALLGDLRTLSADEMSGREVGTPGGEKARAFIVERFREIGVPPAGAGFVLPFTAELTADASVSGANVAARIAGRRHPDRHIVISAHYDHLGSRMGPIYNGANDNASGTAALFAIASHFKRHAPQHSLLLVAFDGEEIGLRGARAFVASPPVAAGSLLLNLNLDMIGRDSDDRLVVVGTSIQPFLKPAIDRVAATASVTLVTGQDDPEQRGRDNWLEDSDHYAFIEAGIPALLFSVADYAEHHRASDDYETMTHDFYVRAVETIIRVVEEFDRTFPGAAAVRTPADRVSAAPPSAPPD